VKCGDGSAPDAPVGVLSAVVTDAGRPGWTLLGVRRPSPLTTRHPGVLSTPTIRLPSEIFAVLVGDLTVAAEGPGLHRIDGRDVQLGRGRRGLSSATYALESLLAAKLGLADALTGGQLRAEATPRFLALDAVEDPLGTQLSEWTLMLTYEVRIVAGVAEIPPATAAYSRLVWVPAAKVPLALAHRDPLLLDETLDAIEVCVQGLCVRVAAELLSPGRGFTGDPGVR